MQRTVNVDGSRNLRQNSKVHRLSDNSPVHHNARFCHWLLCFVYHRYECLNGFVSVFDCKRVSLDIRTYTSLRIQVSLQHSFVTKTQVIPTAVVLSVFHEQGIQHESQRKRNCCFTCEFLLNDVDIINFVSKKINYFCSMWQTQQIYEQFVPLSQRCLALNTRTRRQTSKYAYRISSLSCKRLTEYTHQF